MENPAAGITHYGYANVSAAAPMMPTPNTLSNVEATKTEPDKNTYLTLERQTGPDAGYDYGSHFLFQGHEAGLVVNPPVNNVNRQGAITRINLDADAAHRVTVLATQDVHGNPLPAIDGSTWYPFSQRLLLTAEFGNGPGGSGGASGRPPPEYRRRPNRSVAFSAAAATRASRPTAPAISGSSRTSVGAIRRRARTRA